MNEQPNVRRILRDYGLTILGAVAVALAVRFFLIEAYKIPGAAMKPTLLPGDSLFVSKSSFGIRLPFAGKRLTSGRMPSYGEVVVYSHPSEPPRDSIKRVVGLPGDRVEFKKGRLLLNGAEVSRSERPDSNCGEEALPNGRTYAVCWESPLPEDLPVRTLAPGELLLAADLRAQASGESRKSPSAWVIVPAERLKGSALWIWLSVEPETGAAGSLFARLRMERMFRAVN